MRSKILLLALSAAAFSSCSTAYRSGQTPDDVYYSPVKVQKEDDYREDKREQTRYTDASDYEITMSIRDRRWRDFREDYRYENSPYKFSSCCCMNTSYYYNPYYYPWAIYTTYAKPVNTTPRIVNLNTYKGYNAKVATGKTSGTVTWANPSTQYNNSNRSSAPSQGRVVIVPGRTTDRSSNNTRTYSPSSNNSNNSSSGSSSSGSNKSGSVSRPGRGG